MSRRMDSYDDQRCARAYIDGRLFSADGWGGVRVTVRLGSARPVARFLESTGHEPLEGHMLGIEEALLMAKEMGAAKVLVFCENEAAAELAAEAPDLPARLLPLHLRIRALMNQFHRAAIAPAGTTSRPPGPCALGEFSAAEVRLLGRPRNLSLFPALQA